MTVCDIRALTIEVHYRARMACILHDVYECCVCTGEGQMNLCRTILAG